MAIKAFIRLSDRIYSEFHGDIRLADNGNGYYAYDYKTGEVMLVVEASYIPEQGEFRIEKYKTIIASGTPLSEIADPVTARARREKKEEKRASTDPSPVRSKAHIHKLTDGRWVCRFPRKVGAIRGFGDSPVLAYIDLLERYVDWCMRNLPQ